MKIILYLSPNQREMDLGQALISGFKRHGEKVEFIPSFEFNNANTDLAVFVGVKNKRIYDVCKKYKTPILYIDKGYFKRNEYYRFSLNGYQPPYLTEMHRGPERFNNLGIQIYPRRVGGDRIVYAASSPKYFEFHNLGKADVYNRAVCMKLREQLQGKKRILFRPKPDGWSSDTSESREKLGVYTVPPGAEFSSPNENISYILPNTHCLVTHGSNDAVDAMLNGVPVLSLSRYSPVFDLSEHHFENILNPKWPTDDDRLQLFSNLAWCQFTLLEIAKGKMWDTHKQWYNYKPR